MRLFHRVICGGCAALLSAVACAQIPAPFGIKLGTVMSAATNTVESPVDRRKELLQPREIYTGPDMMFRKSLYSNPITISVPLPKPFLGCSSVRVATNRAGVGYSFSINGTYRRGLTWRESLAKIHEFRAEVERRCGFPLNDYLFYVQGAVADGQRGSGQTAPSVPSVGEGPELWLDMDSVRASSITTQGVLRVELSCSIDNNLAKGDDAPTKVRVTVSLPSVWDAMKRQIEEESRKRYERQRRAENARLSDFYGLKFGCPSGVSTNELGRFEGECCSISNGKTNVKTIATWHERRKDIRPAPFFDFAEVRYSYTTVTPVGAAFYGHFPTGTTRKRSLEILDDFALSMNDRFGFQLSCGLNREEEEPQNFTPGEAPVGKREERSRYNGFTFVSYSFSNDDLFIQLEGGENRYGERFVWLSVGDHSRIDELEGVIRESGTKGKFQ